MPRPRVFNLLVVPDFTFVAYSAVIEPLRLANKLSGHELYAWNTVSLGGGPTIASNGLAVSADYAAREEFPPGTMLVCAGADVQRSNTPWLQGWLRKTAGKCGSMGAVCTGSFLLAEARLLDGYRCTIHWEHIAPLREMYPKLTVSEELFEIDRDRYTCAGGMAVVDMMLHLILCQQGPALSAAVSDQMICDRIRDEKDSQRIPLRHRFGMAHHKLREAVSLMEANIEDPLSLEELSRRIDLSRRQLERLFRTRLQCVPSGHYMRIRLENARRLLLQTSMPALDIAVACGFVSAPHFTKCYRKVFGVPPSEDRRRASSMNSLTMVI